ncbi:MAG TPA: flagellar basal body rod protein FlgC [Planctomycetota bacterium]|nr:flagellar basal body rod protein FlgC [Planctomycetota bacterium]
MFDVMDISSSALTAMRTRMNTIAGNIANIQTTRNAAGQSVPYRRREVVLASGLERGDASGRGVHVAGILEDPSPFRVVPMPGHPDADANGNVHFPNVDLNAEVVSAVIAMRAYEANVAAFEASKSMISHAMRLIA